MNRDRDLRSRPAVAWLLVTLLASATLTAAVGAPMPAAGDRIDRLVAALEGGWAGSDNDTPFGRMPFAALFEWQEDGSLRSMSPLNRETWIELRFARDEDGSWLLHEEAAMEGLGHQRYSLVAGGVTEEGLQRWFWEEDPGYLAIEVGVAEERLLLNVTLRGEPHVAFRLDRQPRESWAEMRREMQAQGELAPAEGVSIREVVSSPPPSLGAPASEAADPVAAARRAVVAAPESAEARLALAMRLGEAINANPAQAPLYAFEMLASLEKAVELDPTLPQAYQGLVGYYLNAPPIAGGSIDKAEATARRLAELDPEAGNALLEQIAARRGGAPPGH